MHEWIRQTFTIISDEAGEWFRFESGGSVVEARIDQFLARFGAVNVPPTASTLKAADPDDAAGWHRHFDAWVEQGIIQP